MRRVKGAKKEKGKEFMVWGWGFYREKGIEQIRNLRYKLHLSVSYLFAYFNRCGKWKLARSDF